MFALRIVSVQRLSVCLAAVAAFATTTAARPQEPGYLGYVWDYSGAWFVGDDTIRIGRGLRHSDTVRVDTTSARLPALVILLESGERVRFLCEDTSACSGPLVPSDSIRERHLSRVIDATARIVRAVVAVLEDASEPETIRARVRGHERGTPTVLPAIVSRTRDSLDLAPVFTDAEAGDYGISIYRDRPVGRAVHNAIAPWRPGGSLILEAADVRAGLHTVVVRPSTDSSRWETSALVLVVHESRYDELLARYDEAVTLTRTWGGGRSFDAALFLGSYLRFLASSAADK